METVLYAFVCFFYCRFNNNKIKFRKVFHTLCVCVISSAKRKKERKKEIERKRTKKEKEKNYAINFVNETERS
jgi:hypothetical protein